MHCRIPNSEYRKGSGEKIMSTADYIYDNTQLKEYLEHANAFQTSIESISKEIETLFETIYSNDDTWLGNGKEACSAFLSLASRYASLVSGNPANITIVESASALDSKSVNGEESQHIDDNIVTTDEQIPEIDRVSKMASDKVESILMLDTVMDT